MKKLALLLAALIAQSALAQEGFALKAGEGETLMNGIVVKLSPQNGTSRIALGEQTFPRGGSTGLHVHDHVSESFYVVSGRGRARLGDHSEPIGPGDVIYVPSGDAHEISALEDDDPLVVVFFMPTSEIVEQMRAVHARLIEEPDRSISADEREAIFREFGGSRRLAE